MLRRAGGDTRVIVLHEKLRRHGRHLVLSGPHTQPYFLLEKAGFLDAVGAENIAADLPEAIARACAGG